MTPEQRAVIEAARTWYSVASGESERDAALVALTGALDAMYASESLERERPWSQVVTEDEIYSSKTGKWYRVLETGQTGRLVERNAGVERWHVNEIQVRTEGVAKAFTVPADGLVRVRRSEMGQAVDVWAGLEIMRSGPGA